MNIVHIKDNSIRELDIYTKVRERQLLHYHEPYPGLFIAESLRIVERAMDAGYEPVSLFIETELLQSEEAQKVIERCGDLPVYCADHEQMIRITRYEVPRGALCAMRRKDPADISEVITVDMHRIVVLEDIMNPTNVGAIFRSAAALGMDAILLTPGCADPLYRRAARVSMGTVFQIPWTYLGEDYANRKDLPETLERKIAYGNPLRNKSLQDVPDEGEQARSKGVLDVDAQSVSYVQQPKSQGYTTVAMALREDTISIDDPLLAKEEKLAIFLGTENTGLKTSTIEACDYTICIPMYHGVDSLNVAAASAVAFWELRWRGICKDIKRK